MKIDSSIQQARIDTPLGPAIFGMRLPENVFQKALKLADDVWARKDRIDWSHELVGHMKHQYYIPHSELKKCGLYEFFIQCFYWYLIKASEEFEKKKEHLIIELEAFWINYQEEGEYNPMHNHGQATLSGAIHLREPEYERPKDRKHDNDGKLTLVNHSPIINALDTYAMTVKPTPRGMYIWPAPLLHEVFPFQGKGQRVSMAYNVVHYFGNNPENRHKAKEYEEKT